MLLLLYLAKINWPLVSEPFCSCGGVHRPLGLENISPRQYFSILFFNWNDLIKHKFRISFKLKFSQITFSLFWFSPPKAETEIARGRAADLLDSADILRQSALRQNIKKSTAAWIEILKNLVKWRWEKHPQKTCWVKIE